MTYQEFQKRYQYNPTTDRIGKGGFGVVFKAYDTHLDRYVALKMSEVADENDSTRLAREVELAAKLPTHPNIAHYEACYTFATPLGTYDFGVLQFYNDGSLDDLIKKNVLTTDEKISILKQILNGIGFLHSNRIVHRDLKPRNILIARRGDKYIPKITDFGISKVFDAGDSSSFANSMVGAGTLAYSSPEQLGERTMHRNADLWSYGVIVCQLFTGELPFTTGGLSPSSIEGRNAFYRQIMSGKLPPLIDKIPEPWQALVRRLLVIDTRERLRNCDAVKAFLADGKESQSAEPYPDDNDDGDKTRSETSAPPFTGTDSTEKGPRSQSQSQSAETEIPPRSDPPPPPRKASKWRYAAYVVYAFVVAVVAVLLGVLLWPKGGEDFEPIAPDVQVEWTAEKVTVNGVEIPMVYVPGGTFTMGATSEQGDDAYGDEKPTHQVTLDGFYIGATEVTQAQWEAVMGDNPSNFRGANLPVESVSYDDALEFCRRLSELTGKHYTLPTEAQWEYAARGGQSGGTKYSGSNTIDNVAWYGDNCNGQTHPVATKSPNVLGLYDMSGNVYEWCLDWYGDYPSLAQTNPQGPSGGDSRVLRGGSWFSLAECCRVSYRYISGPSSRNGGYGFRVVLL